MKTAQHLEYRVHISEPVTFFSTETAPNGSRQMFQPIASTLIFGERDAVLVDPPMTIEQTAKLMEWIEASGKMLRNVFVTHGHGDHWFGTGPLLERFPSVGDDDDPKAIDETRSYLQDAERLSRNSHTALEFYEAMMQLYLERLNPTALWFWGARALFPVAEPGSRTAKLDVQTPICSVRQRTDKQQYAK